MTNDAEKLTGYLDNIRFRGAEGFFILQISLSAPGKGFSYDFGESITALGNMAKQPEKGAHFEFTGEWVVDDKFGKQFKFHSYKTLEPENPEAIIRYLTKSCKGIIGKVIIKRIVDYCGKNTLKYLRERPTEVAKEVKGFSKVKAVECKKALVAILEDEKILLELEGLLGLPYLPKNLPIRAMDKWGIEAVDVLQTNPYQVTDLKRIGFLWADKIAIAMDFDKDSVFRKKAAILHVLKENENNGSTWINMAVLMSRAEELISCSTGMGLDMLDREGIIINKNKNVAFADTDRKEQAIADWLILSDGLS